MRAALLAALLCASALAAGCATPSTPCPARAGGTFLQGPGGDGRVDPAVPADELYLVTGLNLRLDPQVRVNVTAAGSPTPVAAERTEFGNGTQRLERLRYAPGDLARGLAVAWDVHDTLPPRCGAAGGVTFSTGANAQPGTHLTPGHGAHVWYAGFYANGTLFETNIAAFDQSAWPKASWYETVPYTPLPVYVYDQARSEEPAYWKPPTQAARTGTPVDGPLAQPLGAATGASGAGYYSTIKGFNDALKGLSTSGARVAWMAAADAYPAGTPNNPLAGDDLVFYIRLADVVDKPCPTPQATGPPPCPAAP